MEQPSEDTNDNFGDFQQAGTKAGYFKTETIGTGDFGTETSGTSDFHQDRGQEQGHRRRQWRLPPGQDQVRRQRGHWRRLLRICQARPCHATTLPAMPSPSRTSTRRRSDGWRGRRLQDRDQRRRRPPDQDQGQHQGLEAGEGKVIEETGKQGDGEVPSSIDVIIADQYEGNVEEIS